MRHSEIVAVSEDYYDVSILENTSKEYQSASHVVHYATSS
ncbi:DUF3658 domain-containing protein [Bacillus mycoides]